MSTGSASSRGSAWKSAVSRYAPFADDGNTRLDVADQTKSMSKRHAMFTVKSNGTASVRDLGSTNGSYVVRENGDLLRLPANVEFLLPTSPMRMQFGDVPADFIRIDDPVAKPLDLKVPDLFGYAVHEAPQEPDAADMSVDDILDLRAGEPTAIFSADNVRRKVDELELGSLNITQPRDEKRMSRPYPVICSRMRWPSMPSRRPNAKTSRP